MGKKGKIEDESRLQQLADARAKSLEIRRKKAAERKKAKDEIKKKAALFDDMVKKKSNDTTKKKTKVKLEIKETKLSPQVNTTEPNEKDEVDVTKVKHPSKSKFGEKPYIETEINAEPFVEVTGEMPSNEEVVNNIEKRKNDAKKKPDTPRVSSSEESEPDLFDDNSDYLSDDNVDSDGSVDSLKAYHNYKKKTFKGNTHKKNRKKKKKRGKTIRYISSSSDDSDDEIIIRRKKPKKNVIYYEDIKNYINDRNSIENSNSNSIVTAGKTDIEVDPPKQENSTTNQQEEFNRRLEEARKALFTL
jgi:hypothetical protein